jgi:hypothetical protein
MADSFRGDLPISPTLTKWHKIFISTDMGDLPIYDAQGKRTRATYKFQSAKAFTGASRLLQVAHDDKLDQFTEGWYASVEASIDDGDKLVQILEKSGVYDGFYESVLEIPFNEGRIKLSHEQSTLAEKLKDKGCFERVKDLSRTEMEPYVKHSAVHMNCAAGKKHEFFTMSNAFDVPEVHTWVVDKYPVDDVEATHRLLSFHAKVLFYKFLVLK